MSSPKRATSPSRSMRRPSPWRMPCAARARCSATTSFRWANEGKMVAVVPAEEADAALAAMRDAPYGAPRRPHRPRERGARGRPRPGARSHRLGLDPRTRHARWRAAPPHLLRRTRHPPGKGPWTRVSARAARIFPCAEMPLSIRLRTAESGIFAHGNKRARQKAAQCTREEGQPPIATKGSPCCTLP